MGLDMFVYSVSKISEEEKEEYNNKSIYNIASESNINFIRKSDYNAEPNLFEQIIPYLTEISVIDEEIDFDKIRKDFKIPEDAEIYWSHYKEDQIDYVFKNSKGFSKEISIITDDYLKHSVTEIFAFKYEEIAYWRKKHELQDFIYKILKRDNGIQVENCGFYPLSDKQVAEINNYLKKAQNSQRIYREGDNAVVYYEWY